MNIASTAGDMGILANHVPSIEQLKPGVIEILENSTTMKKYFGVYIIHGERKFSFILTFYEIVQLVEGLPLSILILLLISM